MRAVVQRVSEAGVYAGDDFREPIARIGPGVCILLGIGAEDTEERAANLARKISDLRIFDDEQGKLNRSLRDVAGAALVVSQFTLYADCRKGNRPSFTAAAPPGKAQALYHYFVAQLRAAGITTETGRFQTAMKVSLTNEGPVTLILEI
jgi:D-tyrosyl-tRNA(Tyr) deacylase